MRNLGSRIDRTRATRPRGPDPFGGLANRIIMIMIMIIIIIIIIIIITIIIIMMIMKMITMRTRMMMTTIIVIMIEGRPKRRLYSALRLGNRSRNLGWSNQDFASQDFVTCLRCAVFAQICRLRKSPQYFWDSLRWKYESLRKMSDKKHINISKSGSEMGPTAWGSGSASLDRDIKRWGGYC